MKKYVSEFTQHLRAALTIGENTTLTSAATTISNIVITGLGGSGIGGTIISDLLKGISSIPIIVSKDYFLPEFVNKNTLVIVSSYSGDTEETVNAFNIAREKNAMIVCITSGGKILATAVEKNIDYIKIPGGLPPRAALGYSFPQLLKVLSFHKIISWNYVEEIKSAISLMDSGEEEIKLQAMVTAAKFFDKTPVLYSAPEFEGVTIRFRQQINENAKMLTWHHVIPEMNHNELVGWTKPEPQFAVIFLRNETDYSRTQQRMEIIKETIGKCTPHIFELFSKGNSLLERMLYMIHLCDWISVYLAEDRNVDPVEVNVITKLKSALAEKA